MTRTFTFVLEFRGGTYVSQYRGRYPREALKRWSAGERRRLVGGWQSGFSPNVFDEIAAQELTPLTGLSKVWSATVTIGEDFALLNVITTEQ